MIFPGTVKTDGDQITVDLMLQQPTRIANYLKDTITPNLILDQLYSSIGGVKGGAILFSKGGLFPYAETVDTIAPGAEYPTVRTAELEQAIAPVEKIGGKFYISDEAIDRNEMTELRLNTQRLSNSIVRALNKQAIQVLLAAYGAQAEAKEVKSASWKAALATAKLNASASTDPLAALADATALLEAAELGATPNTLVVNPKDRANLVKMYQSDLKDVLAVWGISLVTTPVIAEGEGYLLDRNTTGSYGVEKPLTVETDRVVGNDATMVKASVRMAFAVASPQSVVKLTNLNGAK